MGVLAQLRRRWFSSTSAVERTAPPALDKAVPGMRQNVVRCYSAQGLHRMAYTEWGDPENPRVLVCVHGLTRNGRDFDMLAQALSSHYRVVCPDVVGRGNSDWLKDSSGYGFAQYQADMMVLLARLSVPEVHWLGTSMGGLIGMFLAAQTHTPITRLVLNDVGPVITASSLKRIGDYVGKTMSFADLAEAERYLRAVFAPFGALSDAAWRHLLEHSVQAHQGAYHLRYDPALAEPFRKAFVQADVKFWAEYQRITCPTLLVRGANSDLLSPEVAQTMTECGPKAQRVDIPGVGHAPCFMDEAQIDVVRRFLLAE